MSVIDRMKKMTAGLRGLDEGALRRVAGGQMASTSTSGQPEAGDDTVGDDGGGGGGAGKVSMRDFAFTMK